MTKAQEKMMALLGLAEQDFKPAEEQTTIADVVEALDILTTVVLGGE